jgi:WD40 repeat protein
LSLLTGLSESFGLDGACIVDLPVGTDLGGVTIVRLLAEGGMGRVYEGRQRSPDRSVAVKVLRDGLASPTLVKRFAQEAQVLARLKHPHIAQVYMLGTFPHAGAALPFFVLELVDHALPIDRFASDRRLSTRQIVAIVRSVAAAVAHGHRLGVVHRDLKPGNILVGADGAPKVIDFGVARCTAADLALTTAHGDTGGIVGTLRYMSPEQFEADASAIDSRTDVHAMGLVLHELLTGELPYELRGISLPVAARIIREQEPRVEPRIRHALATAADVGAGEATTLAAVVEKCLQKRPADRYDSADALEADLARWLAGEPVLARPLGRLGRCRRWLGRHRAVVVASSVALAAVGVAAASVALWSQAELRQRAAAEQQQVLAGVEKAYAKVRQAEEARTRGNSSLARSLVAEAVAARPGRPLPIEIGVLSALLDDVDGLDESLAVLRGHADLVTSVAATAEGRRVVTGSKDRTARLWAVDDAGRWSQTHLLEGHRAAIWGVAFSPDGTRVATAAADRTARLWDARDGTPLATLGGHDKPVYGVTFSADGGLVATASGDRTVRLWSVDGEPRGAFVGHEDTVFGVSFSPDGRLLATASGDRTVRLWDVAARDQRDVLLGHEQRVFNVSFSPDGGRLASASEDGTVRVWQPAVGGSPTTLRHLQRVNAAVFAADGARIAVASVDGGLHVWDSVTGRETCRLRGHADGVWSVAALPDGRFVTGEADATARIWDATAAAEPLLRCSSRVQGVAISPDGRLLAVALSEGGVRLWDASTLRELRRCAVGAGRVNAVEFSPDGGRLIAACHDGAVRQFHVADASAAGASEPIGRPFYAATHSPDGGRIATAGDDRRVRVFDAATWTEVAGPFTHPDRALAVAWSRDGRRLSSGCADGIVRLWEVGAQTTDGAWQPLLLHGHAAAVNWVGFSPAGDRLATASSDATVRIWDAATGEHVSTLDGPAGQVWEIAFSPDGTRLGGVGADRLLHLWELSGGRHLAAFEGHADEAWAIAFAPEGSTILTGSWDGTARLWGRPAAAVQRARTAPAR